MDSSLPIDAKNHARQKTLSALLSSHAALIPSRLHEVRINPLGSDLIVLSQDYELVGRIRKCFDASTQPVSSPPTPRLYLKVSHENHLWAETWHRPLNGSDAYFDTDFAIRKANSTLEVDYLGIISHRTDKALHQLMGWFHLNI